MRSRVVTLVISLLVLLLAGAVPALAQGPDLAAAAGWLKSKQAADGGFSDGFSDASSATATADAIIAAAAVGQDPSTWGSPSPLDYLATQASTLTETGPLAKVILAVKAVGLDPTDFANVNLVDRLRANYDAGSGAFKGLVNDHAFAVLALHAVGAELPAEAAATLEALQDQDGGWSFDGRSQSDTNTTAVVIQALLASGRTASSKPVADGLAFLKSQQNPDGGFPYQNPSQYGTATDANSTAYTIQALLAAGQDLADWNHPERALAALQLPDGAFEYQKGQGANFLATVQAVPALAGNTFVKLPAVAAAKAPTVGAAPATTPATLPATGGTHLPSLALVVAGLALLASSAGLALAQRRGRG